MTSRQEQLRTLETEVGALLRRARRVIGDRARAAHPELHSGEYLLLAGLRAAGALRAADLADRFGMDKGGVSRAVTHLGELGLVERTPDPADGRASLLSVSVDGLARLARVDRERSARFEARLADFSDQELGQLVDLLGRYNTALED